MAFPDLAEAGIVELQQGLKEGLFTSVELVEAYLRRIKEVQPELKSVLCTNPKALEIAKQRDEERSKGKSRGLLHGIPITIKDNIATDFEIDGMPTTAGSHALAKTKPKGDAPIVKKLREAGAVIIGKDNLSEWAYWRACGPFKGPTGSEARRGLPSGWSGVGGQTTSPYYPKGNPIGSSAGGGVSTAAGLNVGALGSETFGSIVSPSARNNIVGMRPAPGLVSRHRVIPISSNADSVGPMTRCVQDAAVLLGVIAGPDEADPITLTQPMPVPNYFAELSKTSLNGKRLGLPSGPFQDYSEDGLDMPGVEPIFEKALDELRKLGATIVPCEIENAKQLTDNRNVSEMMRMDFKAEFAEYAKELKENPDNIHNVQDIVDFNNENEQLEMPATYEAQPGLELSQAAPDRENNPAYEKMKKNVIEETRDSILKCMDENKLDAFVLAGAQCDPWSAAQLPQIIVPMGFLKDRELNEEKNKMGDEDRTFALTTYASFPGEPIGLTFAGRRFSEGTLLNFAYAYEQATHIRLTKKTYPEATAKTQLADGVNVSKN